MASKAEHHDFVGVVALDLAKTAQMASEEVSRISSSLASTANEILECQTEHERRTLVTKAMRDYDTAVKWIQVILPPSEEELEETEDVAHGGSSCGGLARPHAHGHSHDLLVANAGAGFPAGKSSTQASQRPCNQVPSAPPPPNWSALESVPSLDPSPRAVPPPPDHPPSLPVARRQAGRGGMPGNQTFHQDSAGSWSNQSSQRSLDGAHEMSQAQFFDRHQHGHQGMQAFQMDGAGSWSNRSSSTGPDSAYDMQHPSGYGADRHQQTAHQGTQNMLSLGLMQQQAQQQAQLQTQQQQQQPQQQPQQQMQQLHHLQQHLQQQQNQHQQACQHPQHHQHQQLQQHIQQLQLQPPMQQSQMQQPQMQQPQMQPQMQQQQMQQQQMHHQQQHQHHQMQQHQMQANSVHGMSGVQNSQSMQGTGPAHHLQGAAQGPPGAHQMQLIALPVGAPPPQGAIMAGSAPMQGPLSTGPSEHCQPMSEVFQQNLYEPAVGGKFRIINPNTGEEVGCDKNSKRLRIVNPGTGQEVLPAQDDCDVENLEPMASLEESGFSHNKAFAQQDYPQANSTNASGDACNLPTGSSWDWPLSRHEIRERIVRIP